VVRGDSQGPLRGRRFDVGVGGSLCFVFLCLHLLGIIYPPLQFNQGVPVLLIAVEKGMREGDEALRRGKEGVGVVDCVVWCSGAAEGGGVGRVAAVDGGVGEGVQR